MTAKFLKSIVKICLKDKERDLKVRAAYQEYDKELIEAQQKQQEIYNNAIPKVVTHQQNAYKVIKIPFTNHIKQIFFISESDFGNNRLYERSQT